MTYLGGSVLSGLPILSLDELIARIDAVQVGDLRALAGELYRAQELSVAGVGPDEGQFLAAIEPLRGAQANGRETPPAGNRDGTDGHGVRGTGALASQPAGR
jgi:hypothetical protein